MKLGRTLLVLILVYTQVFLPVQAQISTNPPLMKAIVPPNVFFTLDDSGSMMFEILPENVGPVGNAYDTVTVNNRTWTRNNVANNWCLKERNDCWVVNMFPRPNNVYNNNGAGDYDQASQKVTVGFNHNITVARMRSAAVNTAYYDPNIRYFPWVDPNSITVTNPTGNLMPNADFQRVKWNPVTPTNGSTTMTMNLAMNAVFDAAWLNDEATDFTEERREFFPATYYVYNRSNSNRCTKSELRCFTRIEIRDGANFGEKPSTRSDCSSTKCSYNEELQNFANWFQYYRSRINIARAGVAKAFAQQSANMRVGFGAINKENTKIQGVTDDFSPASKITFLNNVYTHPIPKAGTPLRKAMDDVGKYFMERGNTGPWASKDAQGRYRAQLSCRQNYNILMTDGYWNGDGASSSGIKDVNVDGLDGNEMVAADGRRFTYQAQAPYRDGESNTLADVAMYYWKNDLRPDWGVDKKNVPSTLIGNDIAFWQHLVQYTVGLGVQGSLNPSTDLPSLTSGNRSWPVAATNQVDDLWHAALNSRGNFFNASNPSEFAQSLYQSLNEIVARGGDAAAVATSNSILGPNTKIYTSTYTTGEWTGRLQQRSLDPDTGAVSSIDWSTDTTIPTYTERKIVTSGAGGQGGVLFQYNNLTPEKRAIFIAAAAEFIPPAGATEQERLQSIATGQELVDYLRGNRIKESIPFRRRPVLLGDLVNSDPQYVKEGRDGGYGNLPPLPGQTSEGNGYINFYNGNAGLIDPNGNRAAGRTAMVYVGSNDGMMHAFRASDGVELFAFVPQAIMYKLPRLSKKNYTHDFFVDATPMVADAAIGASGGSPWRTVLVSGLGAGGKGIFALDVTNPTNFSHANVMWEMGEQVTATDNDLGFTFGIPQVGRLKDGRWVAIFGNGYDSVNKKAVLYVVDLSNGNVIMRLDTGVGEARVPNGLSTPKISLSRDGTIDSVYAGDLLGNMWKFEMIGGGAGTNTTFRVAFNRTPLYQAGRPITTQAQLYTHPLGGLMVLFGTGKLFEVNDNASRVQESLFGVWDKADVPVNSSWLVEQSLEATTLSGNVFYTVSNHLINWNRHRGWTIPLDINLGERLVTDPTSFEGQVIYTTLLPNSVTDPCATDGKTTTLQLNPLTGGALSYRTIDTSGDQQITSIDAMVSGRQTKATYGTTIIKKGGGNLQIIQADARTGENQLTQSKGVTGIPSMRLWRQILNVQ